MPEPSPRNQPTALPIQAKLQEIAQLLREADHLEPEAQQALAGLLDEINRALDPAVLSSGETAHLAESVAQLGRALHQRHDTGLLAAARERLERAVVRAETTAPVAAGLVRRLLEAVANLGI
jgi:hypothetical protein